MIIPNLIAPPSGRASAPDDPAFDYLARVAADSGQVLDASGLIQNVNRYKIPNAMGSNLFDKASIVIDANGGIKAGKMYALKPANGDADLDYVRNSPKWLQGRDGVLVERAANVPGVRWSNTRQRWELFPERGATNLLLRSQDFGDAVWSKTNYNISINVATAPDGTMTADKLIPSTASTNKILEQLTSGTAGIVNTAYVFAKADGYSFIQITTLDSHYANFSLIDGSVFVFTGTSPAITAKTTAFPDGWYLCEITTTYAGPPRFRASVIQSLADERFPTFAGDGTSGVLFWQAQLETGTIATSPIVTTGAIASRAADVCSKTGLADYIGQTEGTIYAEVNLSNINTGVGRRIFVLSDGTSDNLIQINTFTENSRLQISVTQGGVSQVAFTSVASFTGFTKIAVGYAADNVVFYVNGQQLHAGISATIPACSQFNLGSSFNGAAQFNDDIGPVIISKQRLSNDELQAATTI
jgi:hypothetical protein